MEKNKEVQDELVHDITHAYDEFIHALDQFSDDRINTVPFAGSWTPGQVAVHIIKATSGIPDKNTTAAERPYDEKIPAIAAVFMNFSSKMNSPEFVLPGEGPFVKQELLAKLQAFKERHIQTILHTDHAALCLDFELPNIGKMTRYEWLRFIGMHVKRHHYQLTNML